jgi:hypothetical protein
MYFDRRSDPESLVLIVFCVKKQKVIGEFQRQLGIVKSEIGNRKRGKRINKRTFRIFSLYSDICE